MLAKALELNHDDPLLHMLVAQHVHAYHHNALTEASHIDAAAVRAGESACHALL